jgi:hypothetical protein
MTSDECISSKLLLQSRITPTNKLNNIKLKQHVMLFRKPLCTREVNGLSLLRGTPPSKWYKGTVFKWHKFFLMSKPVPGSTLCLGL